MSIKSKAIVGFIVLFGAFVTASVSASIPEMSVSECVSQKGKTEAECQAMMGRFRNGERPKMTVANCIERMGKTESECQALMEKRENGERPPMGGEWKNAGQNEGWRGDGNGPEKRGVRPENTAEGLSVRAERQKEERRRAYEGIEVRTEKFIDFLESKGVDTTEVKSMREVFKAKAESVLSAFDSYIAALKDWESGKTESKQVAIETSKAALKGAATEAKTYYHETLLTTLRTLVDHIKE